MDAFSLTSQFLADTPAPAGGNLSTDTLLLIVAGMVAMAFRISCKIRSRRDWLITGVGALGLAAAIAIAVLTDTSRGAHAETIENLKEVVFLATLGVGAVVVIWRKYNSQGSISALASRFGLEIKPQPKAWGIFPTTPMVEGLYKGRKVSFYAFDKKAGLSRRPYSAVAATMEGAPDFVLRVRYNPGMFRLMVDTNLEQVLTEDMEFDRMFLVKSNNPGAAKRLLTPEVREELTTARRQNVGIFRQLLIEKSEARYIIPGGLGNSTQTEDLAARLDLVCNLAKAVETAL